MIATVEERFGGSVHMKRRHAPQGVSHEVAVSDEDFKKLTPVTGNPDVSVPDLVALMDVNTGAVLHNLRLRYSNDDIFTAIGPIIVSVNPYKKLEMCSAEALGNMKEVHQPSPTALQSPCRLIMSPLAMMARAEIGVGVGFSGTVPWRTVQGDRTGGGLVNRARLKRMGGVGGWFTCVGTLPEDPMRVSRRSLRSLP